MSEGDYQPLDLEDFAPLESILAGEPVCADEQFP
jgi:hypothetical protein